MQQATMNKIHNTGSLQILQATQHVFRLHHACVTALMPNNKHTVSIHSYIPTARPILYTVKYKLYVTHTLLLSALTVG